LLLALLDWKWELVAVVFSLLLSLGAVVLLTKSNGAERSSTGTLTLNSELALISTVLRAALVFVLGQGTQRTFSPRCTEI